MDPYELRFHIHAFTKATIPMSRLAEYLLDLGVILGENHSVHFDRIEDGSAVPVIRVDAEAEPKVIRNAQRARDDDAPQEVQRAKVRLEQKLVLDNAKGAELIDKARGFKLLEFRGRAEVQAPWGPIRQAGDLTGFVINIGGKNDPVPVRLQDGPKTYVCNAKRDVARKLKAFLLEDRRIRVHGYGKWTRDDQGNWHMEEFAIAGFEELDTASLGEALQDLRSIKSEWLEGEDPIGELKKTHDM